MNVFVLCTGRCGSTSFSKACNHIKNYTCGHESNWTLVGEERLAYPENHIEVDNRLSWLLGRLDKTYGDEAFYVHLRRDNEETAKSFNKRWVLGNRSVIKTYAESILLRDKKTIKECLDFCRTVNSNIELFLRDKSKTMEIEFETVKEQFPVFCEKINAKVDLPKALAEFDMKHNQSPGFFKMFVNRQVWRVKRFLLNK